MKLKWGIPTRGPRGIRFRSKLEVAWATWLDAHRVSWEYEVDGYDFGRGLRYLPDFWLPELRTFLEVKGILDDVDAAKLTTLAVHAAPRDILVALVQIAEPTEVAVVLPSPRLTYGGSVLGASFCEYRDDEAAWASAAPLAFAGLRLCPAAWGRCGCGAVQIQHADGGCVVCEGPLACATPLILPTWAREFAGGS